MVSPVSGLPPVSATTAERDANFTGNVGPGFNFFNVTTGTQQITFDGTVWEDFSTGGGGGAVATTVLDVRSTGGVDTPGNGLTTAPYLNVSYALSQTTDAAISKPYVIDAFGILGDTDWTLKPYIDFDFEGGSYSVTNQATLGAAWSAGGRCSVKNCSSLNLAADILFDFNAVSAGQSQILFENVKMGSSALIEVIGNPASNNGFFGDNLGATLSGIADIEITNASLLLTNGCSLNTVNFHYTNATANPFLFIESTLIQNTSLFENTTTSNLNLDLKASSLGEVTFRSTAAGTLTVNAVGTLWAASITIDGVNTFLEVDVLPAGVSLIFLNGATESTNLILNSRYSVSAGSGITYDPLTGVIAATGGVGDLLAANNLSDVANKETSQRNLGLATLDDQITDNLDRVYTAATQPAVMLASYSESGHSIQLCPFNETASPTSGFAWGLLQNQGPSSFDLLDSLGSLISPISPGSVLLIKNNSQTVTGDIEILPYVAFINNQISAFPIIDLQATHFVSKLGEIVIDGAKSFNIDSAGAAQNSIAGTPNNSGTGVDGSVGGVYRDDNRNIQIVALKVWDGHFSVTPPASRTVVVYDRNTQFILGQATVLKTDPLVSGYRVAILQTPIVIPAGAEIVVMQEYYQGDFWYGNTTTPTPGLTLVEAAVNLTGGGVLFPTTFIGVVNQAYAGFFDFEVISELFEVTTSEAKFYIPLSINSADLAVTGGGNITLTGGGDIETTTGRFFGSNPGGGDPLQPTYSSASSTTSGFDIPGAGATRIVTSGSPSLETSITQVKCLYTTATTSSTTGALINAGGFGNAGDIRNDGDLYFDGVIASVATLKTKIHKVICNEAIGAGLTCKVSATAFRVELADPADPDTTGIICTAVNTTTAAGQVQEVRGLEPITVVLNTVASPGDLLEKSGAVAGRVVAAPASVGTYAVAFQSGVIGDEIVAVEINNEVF